MIETALLYLLTDDGSPSHDSALGAIIGERLYPVELPQKPAYPAATYQVVRGTARGYTMDGQDGATPFRVQFDLYAETYGQAVAMRRALMRDLSGFQGEVPTSPPVLIHGAFADNEGDSAESALEPAGPRVKRKSLDFIIWTKEG